MEQDRGYGAGPDRRYGAGLAVVETLAVNESARLPKSSAQKTPIVGNVDPNKPGLPVIAASDNQPAPGVG
jgi:hypothetical protein